MISLGPNKETFIILIKFITPQLERAAFTNPKMSLFFTGVLVSHVGLRDPQAYIHGKLPQIYDKVGGLFLENFSVFI
jgi:hypothetical protein